MMMLTVKSELKEALTSIYGEREASLIAKYYFQDKSILDPHYAFSESELIGIRSDIHRLIQSEPLQYVTGISHFYGYQYKVNRHVLIPRPETEELVQLALKKIKFQPKIQTILDIGTGSGCIVNTLALETKSKLNLIGIDISAEALDIASINSTEHKTKVNFIQMDFLDKTLWSQIRNIDMIVSNPPYISTNEAQQMEINVLNHEPHVALFSHEDPLLFYKKIAEFGLLVEQTPIIICEINEHLGKETKTIFESVGYDNISIVDDLQGKNRIIKVVPNRFYK